MKRLPRQSWFRLRVFYQKLFKINLIETLSISNMQKSHLFLREGFIIFFSKKSSFVWPDDLSFWSISGAKRNSSGNYTVEFQGWDHNERVNFSFPTSRAWNSSSSCWSPRGLIIKLWFLICSVDFGNKLLTEQDCNFSTLL